jgi:molybdopterin-containing oxidoreductase family iron-sulfur binding subunit
MGEHLEERSQPGMRRRDLLRGAGALGLALGALAVPELIHFRDEVLAAPVPSSTQTTHQWAMVIDLRRCDGCAKCTAACQKEHYLTPDQTWIKVYRMTDAEGNTYHMPRPCMQCEEPPCLRVCPVGATFRTDEGLVLVDQNVCIGCRACMAACPYEARYFNWSKPPTVPRQPTPPSPAWPTPQVQGTVGKCVFCAAHVDQGMLPSCVTACPMQAIYFGDLTTDVATDGQGQTVSLSQFLSDNNAVRYREELGTRPRVYYILGHGQDLSY